MKASGWFRLVAATLAFAAAQAVRSEATDIYLTPLRGLTPQVDIVGDVRVEVGHFGGTRVADVAGESRIGSFRLLGTGSKRPLIVTFAFPLIVSGDGYSSIWTCTATPRVARSRDSCEGNVPDALLSGTDGLRVLVQRIRTPDGSAILITHEIEIIR